MVGADKVAELCTKLFLSNGLASLNVIPYMQKKMF